MGYFGTTYTLKVNDKNVCLADGTNCPGENGLWTTSGNNIYNTNSGNVGIGTTNPIEKLEVFDTGGGGIKVSGPHPGIIFSPSTGATKQGQWHQSGDVIHLARLNEANIVQFYLTAPEASLILMPSGNVGIGTTSPGARLEVDGGASIFYALTTVDPDLYANKVVIGNTQDGSGWDAIGIGSNYGPGNSWAIGHNRRYFEIGVGDGTNDNSIFSVMRVTPSVTAANRTLVLLNRGGNVGIGTLTSPEYPESLLTVADSGYFQFRHTSAGAPLAADCDTDSERGRISIDTTNNRLYICNGAARGWDYVALTD